MNSKKTEKSPIQKQNQDIDLKEMADRQRLQNKVFKKMIDHISKNPIKKQS